MGGRRPDVLFLFQQRYVRRTDKEDEVRDLIGRMGAAQRQGFHVAPAAMTLVLAALRFYLRARGWLTAVPEPARKAPQPYAGPLPTIGDMRRLGLVALSVHCEGPDCWNSRRITFAAMALDDATPFLDIPRRRRFRCERCGSRRVRVAPDWIEHVAQGNGRTASDPR